MCLQLGGVTVHWREKRQQRKKGTKRGLRCSAVGTALDRHATEAGLIPPVRHGIFLPESTFSADSLEVSVHPHMQPHALTPVRMLKIQ